MKLPITVSGLSGFQSAMRLSASSSGLWCLNTVTSLEDPPRPLPPAATAPVARWRRFAASEILPLRIPSLVLTDIWKLDMVKKKKKKGVDYCVEKTCRHWQTNGAMKQWASDKAQKAWERGGDQWSRRRLRNKEVAEVLVNILPEKASCKWGGRATWDPDWILLNRSEETGQGGGGLGVWGSMSRTGWMMLAHQMRGGSGRNEKRGTSTGLTV